MWGQKKVSTASLPQEQVVLEVIPNISHFLGPHPCLDSSGLSIVHNLRGTMGGACGAYGGGERCAQGSGGETRGKETIGETQT